MKQRRSIRKQLEARLRAREPEVERLWRSYDAEASGTLPPHLAERLERRMTWGLWSMALHEAVALMDELAAEEPEPQMLPSWLCQSCKRRILRVVEPTDDLSATA